MESIIDLSLFFLICYNKIPTLLCINILFYIVNTLLSGLRLIIRRKHSAQRRRRLDTEISTLSVNTQSENT